MLEPAGGKPYQRFAAVSFFCDVVQPFFERDLAGGDYGGRGA